GRRLHRRLLGARPDQPLSLPSARNRDLLLLLRRRNDAHARAHRRGQARRLRGAPAGRGARIRQRQSAHAPVPRALRDRHAGAPQGLARPTGFQAAAGRCRLLPGAPGGLTAARGGTRSVEVMVWRMFLSASSYPLRRNVRQCPRFRSSSPIGAVSDTNFGSERGTGNSMIPAPLFDLKVPNELAPNGAGAFKSAALAGTPFRRRDDDRTIFENADRREKGRETPC